MDSEAQLLAEIDALFHPRSVAIVGVPRGMKAGKLFFMALLDQKFPGEIYPVSPHADEIDGFKAYPTVTAIPGPVDLAIVLVPHHLALPVVKDCAAKGVKGAILFTAGYRETGTPEGVAMQEELVKTARAAGMRLIGPNCMGLYAPRSGLAFFPELAREPGDIGLISHSGSLANIFCHAAPEMGLRFSKAVSLGNECDLTSADFLLYLGRDEETRIIGAYIEGISDDARFFAALADAARRKPVIIWKVGLTAAGARAAASHTGALAGSADIWEGIVRQTGAIPVVGFEQWADTLMGFRHLLPFTLGDRLAILSGPGGFAVSAAEACAANGMCLAELAPESTTKLAGIVPPTGTSLRNPVDVGLTASLEIEIYIESMKIIAADPNVDAVLIIGTGLNRETNERLAAEIIAARGTFAKPILIVKIPGRAQDLAESFTAAGIPFFDSAERALATYARIRTWQRRQRVAV